MSQPAHIVHLREIHPRPSVFTVWERQRHGRLHWLNECVAEFLGVFFYVYCGVGSTATFVLGSILRQTGLSSVFQIGAAYAFGIVFAIAICAPTSGGHFSPGITISFVLFKGFPPLKALRYIIAQILGGYIACLLVYVQFHDFIKTAEAGLAAAGALEAVQFTPNGTGGILALYTQPGANLGRAFLNEFVCCVFLAIVIWGCLDPSSILIPPMMLPFVIAAAYATAIWGFVMPGIALNAARDVGGRLAALTIYGTKASGGSYAAIAALTNIPATIVGALIYEFFLTDSDRVIPSAQRELLEAHKYHGKAPVATSGDRSSGSVVLQDVESKH